MFYGIYNRKKEVGMIDYYETKTQPVTKRMVWEAYHKVRKQKGGPGIDQVTLADYAKDLSANLYKLWNRMSSGSYFPPEVKVIEIDKKTGGKRRLGIPTVSDRIAQQVVKSYLEPKVDFTFHEDSYGYRRGKDAHQALEKAIYRCRYYPWVIDMDISKFFDNLDHELMLKALKHYTEERWVIMYVERWLKAGMLCEDEYLPRDQGTPQGGVISPLLANMYLHFAFDKWMEKNHPWICFERFADDIVIHCKSEKQAHFIKAAITERLSECKLRINEEKTHMVYCRSENHKDNHKQVCFDFLGYTFRPRLCRTRSGVRLLYLPCMSRRVKVEVTRQIRKLKLHKHQVSIQELASFLNPKIRGWMQYYCRFSQWTTVWVWRVLNLRLVKWLKWTRRFSKKRAIRWLIMVYKRQPNLFAHWRLVHF